MKLSPGKHSLPGRKQVWRTFERHKAVADVLGLAHEAGPLGGVPLLRNVMVDGRRLAPAPALPDVRDWCLRRCPAPRPTCAAWRRCRAYPVIVSTELEALEQKVNDRLDRLRA